MAERVGKDVEQFAEMLDQGNTKTRGLEPPALYDNTLELVSQFHSHATKKVKELEVREAAANRGDRARDIQRRIQRMADTPQRSLGLDNDEESVVSFSDKGTTPKLQELRHWQNEVATWNLFRTIIDLYHPKPGFNAATDKKQRLLDLEKKYAERPDQEIWNKFLLEDTVAMEKFKILKWLEKSADSNESDVPSIVAQLEAESGKSMSTWTSGWLDTKHMIKAEKRLRQTGRPLRPDETSIRSADATKELVVQLDPDASSRQRRHLVKSDDYYERAMWMTCYEMLRRGKSWESILEWCREHNESWRGVSMGLTSGGKGDAPTCLTGPYLGSLFRRTCYALAQGSDFRYECAVFGLLSGDLPSVEGVCRTWDDHLYARYNALLLSRFDSYLQAKHADKIPPTLNRNFPTFDAVSFHGDWSTSNRRVVELLKDQNHIKSQAKSPFKLIQGHLIARTFDELVFNVGNMLITREFDEALTLPPGLQPPKLDTPDDYYDGLFQDHNQLRILVHILIVFRTLGMTVGRGHELQETLTDNVIVRFMTLLRQARRFKVIPTYAAQLCATRQTSALASVLPYVGSNAREQKDMCNLIEQANINLMEVVFLGYFSAVHHSGLIEHEDYIKRYNMLETPVSDAYLWPGQRTKGNFLDLNTLPADLAVIESLEWFLHVKKNMGEMLMCLSDAMKMFVRKSPPFPQLQETSS
jgi:nuclear pore complex protein Nup107